MSIPHPLKWWGGKSHLAKRIVALMPPRADAHPSGWLHYVEPYFGGGSVLLEQDPEGISEVANDIHLELMNFWEVLRDPTRFAEFARDMSATPFSEVDWQEAIRRHCFDHPDQLRLGRMQSARHFFVLCRQSMTGRMKSFAPLSRSRVRRGMNEQASAWLTAVEGLPAVHERLKRVVVLNRPAIDVIRQQDGPRTLFYCDPPYVHETRATTGEYAHEMTHTDHLELLRVLKTVEGKVILSGYPSALYDEVLAGWRVVDFDLPNNAAGGAEKRRMTERCWMNYEETQP